MRGSLAIVRRAYLFRGGTLLIASLVVDFFEIDLLRVCRSIGDGVNENWKDTINICDHFRVVTC